MWRLLINLTDSITINKLISNNRTLIITRSLQNSASQSNENTKPQVNNVEGVKNIANTASTLGPQNGDDQNKASLEKLTLLGKELEYHLPKLFVAPHPMTFYTKDLIFIDNIRGVKCKGLSQYSLHITLIKLYHHINYSSTTLNLLNLVKNPEESSIKIRWRITSKPGLIHAILFFWNYNSKSSEIWRDGLSTMVVDRDGKIFCHICDNIEADLNKEAPSTKETLKERLVNRGLV